MAATTYLLTKTANSAGECQIILRTYIRHDYRMRIQSRIWINPKRWGKKNSITIPATPGEEQEQLIEKKELLLKLTRYIEDELKHVEDKSSLDRTWGEKKVAAFYKPAKATKERVKDFFDIAADYLTKHKLSESRIKHFNVLIRCIKRYELYKRATGSRSFKLNIATLSYDQLADIEYFLTNEREVFKSHPEIYDAIPYLTKQSKKTYKPKKESDKLKGMPKERGQNYISDMMTRFRSFIIWANDNEYTTNNPFKNYSVGESVYGTPIYISNDERKKLYETDMSDIPSVAVQRDIFVFQCLIGCRVSDLYKFTWKNVINGAIEYIPKKTREDRVQTVRVPLSDTAKEILERYRDPHRESLLPFISSQKYNDNIKEAFKKADLDRMVKVIDQRTRQEVQKPIYEVASSHMARRSFIGNIYKQVKDPNLVGALSGHKEGSKAFARYRDIDEDMKKELIGFLE
ncbi:MAG: site-specific integrase [Rikenellaceae bacterium]|nr:site-specific integrase [Rikenellaceae bacterium]